MHGSQMMSWLQDETFNKAVQQQNQKKGKIYYIII